jgi:general secretion pathway protein H
MAISVTGRINCPAMPRTLRGFTLLELMVVVVLIGIILTFVVRSVGDGGRRDRLQREVQRITALVELVGEEAVLKSSVIGMRFEEQGYLFMRYGDGAWEEVEGDELLKPHQIGGAMEMELLVEGYSVDLAREAQPIGGGEEVELKPQVVFLPGGERTPFELALRYQDDESGYLLNVPPLGDVEQRQLEGRW